MRSIDAREFKDILGKDKTAVIIDVRTPGELTGRDGKLKTAINIPVNDLRRRMGDLEKYRDREIHVICASGSRSLVAASLLANAGFRSVNIKGGMSAVRRIITEE